MAGWASASNPGGVVGVGDFTDNGTSECVRGEYGWIGRHSADEERRQQRLDGPQRSNLWRVVGVGDFNGDGTADVLYQNADGSVGALLMKNGANDSWVNLSGPTSWRVVGVGDFNGDGTSDVLYQNTDGSGAHC